MVEWCSNVLFGFQGTEMTEDQNYIGGTAKEETQQQKSWMEYSNTIHNSVNTATCPVNNKGSWEEEKACLDEWLYSEQNNLLQRVMKTLYKEELKDTLNPGPFCFHFLWYTAISYCHLSNSFS